MTPPKRKKKQDDCPTGKDCLDCGNDCPGYNWGSNVKKKEAIKKTPNKTLFWSNDKTAKWSKKSVWDVKKTPKAVKAWILSYKNGINTGVVCTKRQIANWYMDNVDDVKVIEVLITPIKKQRRGK